MPRQVYHEYKKVSSGHNSDWGVYLDEGVEFKPNDAQLQIGASLRIAVAMERMVEILECPNFLGIPYTLKGIRTNTNRLKTKKGKQKHG